MKHDYPYIADKTMFKAVMFACNMIRENGYFNKACKTASRYYRVSEEELKQHIRKRQSAGQIKKNQEKEKRKYCWFTCCTISREESGYQWCSSPFVQRALKAENVYKIINYADGIGGRGVSFYKAIKQHKTKEAAEKNLEKDFHKFAKDNTWD